MKIFNTLTRQVEDFRPAGDMVRMYSCGPTVYDHIHIGNLSAFIAADTLRRTLKASGYGVRHVMNFTDVDDKTIRRSAERYPDLTPGEALQKLTDEYKQVFLSDMQAIGNDVNTLEFTSAVDSIEGMRALIADLYKDGFAYITDDGVYFSIEKYRASGKKYGQLTEITAASTSEARIQNDEYDKESVHDFALWKMRKDGEPAWQFDLDNKDLTGRPGWHIECSAMSVQKLGQPFDIHTGGVDLIFPHHENEIAQSTAGGGDVYATYFVHNEHLLVDGKKMSKSLNNFFTLRDIQEKGYDPLAFRLMVLQSHYRSQSNFSWENLEAAQNRLVRWRTIADLRWQEKEGMESLAGDYDQRIVEALVQDMDTPRVLQIIEEAFTELEALHLCGGCMDNIFDAIESYLGIHIMGEDVSETQKKLLDKRQTARDNKDFTKSDEIRDQLKEQGIGVRDTNHGQIWFRI